MQQKAIQIEFTPLIKEVFQLYEEARPKTLAKSYLREDTGFSEFNEEFNEDKVSNDTFPKLKNVMENFGNDVAKAEVGALLGQKGVAAVAGIGLIGGLWNCIAENKSNSKVFYNLSYLKPEQFLFNIETSFKKTELETIQALYNYSYDYQQLKGERTGFSLLGWKFGEHREENNIDDFKYLINIFIGRKLKHAANALTFHNEKLYKKHLKHMLAFLDSVSKNETLLWSRSDDTTYASIRNVINKVKKDLTSKNKTDQSESEMGKLLNQLEGNLNSMRIESIKSEQRTEDRLIHLLCAAPPNSFRSLVSCDSFNKELSMNNEIYNLPYHKLLYNALFSVLEEQNKQSEEECFLNGLTQFSGKQINDEKIYDIFYNIILQKNELSKLFKILSRLNKIKNNGGLNALTNILDQIEFLLLKIKEAQATLNIKMRKFVDQLASKVYSGSNQQFKNNFTSNGYVALPSYIEPLNNAVLVLKQLGMDKQNLKNKIEENLQNEINEFNSAVFGLGYTEDNKLNIMECVPDEHKEDNDDFMKGWVIVKLEEEGNRKEPTNNLPEEIKSQPWYKSLFQHYISTKPTECNSEVTKLKKQVTKQTEALNDLNKKNEFLSDENIQKEESLKILVEENRNLKTERLYLNQDLTRRESIIAKKNMLINLKPIFVSFIDDYISKNRASSCFSIWHFHGQTGINMAERIKCIFTSRIGTHYSSLNNKNAGNNEIENIQIDKIFSSIMTSHANYITGNFHPHSLKTYLLAFSRFLAKKENRDMIESDLSLNDPMMENKYQLRLKIELQTLQTEITQESREEECNKLNISIKR